MIPDLHDLAIQYMDSADGVGCEQHSDPACLCDVIVTDPVPIRYPLGNDKSAVLFSQTVNAEFPVREELEMHLIALAALYEAAAPRLDDARREIHEAEEVATHGQPGKRWIPTPEEEYWLRRNIPSDWCAWNLDKHPTTVKAWRKRNGVQVDEFQSGFQAQNARWNTNVKHEPTYKLDVNDPAIRAILENDTLSHNDISEMLNVSRSCVKTSRARIGYRARSDVRTGRAHNQNRKHKIDWTAPTVTALLDDASMSLREVGEALGGVSMSVVHRQRAKRRAILQT